MKSIVYILTVFICFIIPNLILAQNTDETIKKGNYYTRKALVKLPNADAQSAIEIEDSIAGPFNVSLGYGIQQEVITDQGNETNSAWFKFTVDYDTTLTFDIVPFDSLDDYDFVLFKCLNANCLGSNKGSKIMRFCFSQCFSKSGMTGLSQYTQSTIIGSGTGPAYASSVNVKAGDTYYLMVNYGQEYMYARPRPAGFTIFFYNYYPKRKPITLNNIFFETGKAILKTESFPELDKLAHTLKSSQMVIEIRGHTDNEGDEKKNQLLSEERAKAVVDYLLSKQINKNRLFYKGFGSSKPIASNNTKEGRQKNRRVEFVKVMY